MAAHTEPGGVMLQVAAIFGHEHGREIQTLVISSVPKLTGEPDKKASGWERSNPSTFKSMCVCQVEETVCPLGEKLGEGGADSGNETHVAGVALKSPPSLHALIRLV